MKVLRILSDVRLVIAELEVHLGEDVRNSPTLCAVVPGVAGPQHLHLRLYRRHVARGQRLWLQTGDRQL